MFTVRRPSLAALAVAGLGALALVPVIPTDVQMPGTQPLELSDDLKKPDDCASCHAKYDVAVEPFRNWQGSMMSHATRDPLFWASLAVAEQDFPSAGDLCLRCHSPAGWLGGRSGASAPATARLPNVPGEEQRR